MGLLRLCSALAPAPAPVQGGACSGPAPWRPLPSSPTLSFGTVIPDLCSCSSGATHRPQEGAGALESEAAGAGAWEAGMALAGCWVWGGGEGRTRVC